VTALADHIVAGYGERVRAAVPDSRSLDQLCAIIDFCIADAQRDPISVRAYQSIIAAGLSRSDLKPVIDRMARQAIDDIAGLIRDGQQRGEIRADVRPRAEASLIVASLRGVLFQWLVIPDHVSLSRMRDCLLANIRNSLKV
jgi:hypothetical protein